MKRSDQRRTRRQRPTTTTSFDTDEPGRRTERRQIVARYRDRQCFWDIV